MNEVARGLATNKSKTIGVLIHNLDNIFASTIITHIEDVLRKNDYATFICDSRGDINVEKDKIQFLLSKRVDGIITIPTSRDSKYLEKVVERGIPVVLIDRVLEKNKFDAVLVDNESASEEAINVLIQHGHKRIAIICGNENQFTGAERLKGYRNALHETNLPIDDALIIEGELTVEHGYEAMKALMKMKNRPTGIFLSNYEITLGAVIAANEMSISFPEDISLIGFDNMMLAQVVKPKLWMVSQPMKQIAECAAEMMIDRLKGNFEETARRVILMTDIIEGQSIKKLVQ